ncbi:hypothetical protein F945_02084 [Acinetobacter rudis CIP 110305]|uniref:Uncharacterized protein n=1 Tax=Acinetobacter rudis CIP 110305 TaxID=421052 RepID=S3N4F9_9GAMM|nr:hypothetical protein F945_02084 [Acinetobacter rudis CIP 110305]
MTFNNAYFVSYFSNFYWFNLKQHISDSTLQQLK